MEMTNVNRDLEDYKLNELFELAAWLHGEEFPSPVIVKKKKAVVEMLANQLSVERKEIIWMVEAKGKKRIRIQMHEREREHAAVLENNKNWELLTREVKTLTTQNIEIIHQNDLIIKALTKMEVKMDEEMEKK